MQFLGLFLLVLCGLTTVLAKPQFQNPRPQFQDPKISISGGGTHKNSVDLNVNLHKNLWQSNNGRHSLGATGSYSQHWGGPDGNPRPKFGAGGVYTFRF